MGSPLWSSDRPEFTERVAKLAGGTTYRVPMEGKGTKFDQLPDAHAIAAALSFARRGPQDIGPDVAYCWVLQNDSYRRKVVNLLGTALRCPEFRGMGRFRFQAANDAWEKIIWDRPVSRPPDAPRGYDELLLVAIGTMYQSAWDSLAEAERCYQRESS